LNFSPSTKKTTEYSFELFLSIYRYKMFFFPKLKTSALLNNRFGKQAIRGFLKTPSFKSEVVMQFPAKENAVAQKHCAEFPTLRGVVLGLPSPSPRLCTDGRARVR